MGRFHAILLALLAAGCEGYKAPTEVCSPKPEAPIEIDARLVGDPAAPFGIHARASSRTGADVELEVLLPDGVAHLGGERRAQGRIPELRVDARHDAAGRREILVRATVRQGRLRSSRVVSIPLPGAPPASPGTLKTDSRGQAILEFRP